MSPGFTLFVEVLGAVASIVVILEWCGIKPKGLSWGLIMPLSQKWKLVIMFGVVALSLGFSAKGYYNSRHPRIVEKIVERPVDRIVEKIVQAECPKTDLSEAAKPATKKAKKDPAIPTAQAQQPTMTQDCGGGNCAQSSGQTGGITAGQINLGPPPMKIKFSAEPVTSTKSEFSYETKVIISTSVNYTPVSLAIICDVALAPGVSFDFGPNGSTLLGASSGLALEDNRVAWVKFGGTAVSEDYPLYVHLWSKEPVHVLKVVPAKVKQQP